MMVQHLRVRGLGCILLAKSQNNPDGSKLFFQTLTRSHGTNLQVIP